MIVNRMMTSALILLMLQAGLVSGTEPDIPAEHPRLLIRRDDLASLRKRCGVERYRNDPTTTAPYADCRGAFDHVRLMADRIVKEGAKPGQLYAAALAHLVFGETGRRDPYVDAVERDLQLHVTLPWRQDDTAIALDWCWDALEPSVREKLAAQLAERLEPLTDRICPWDHVLLHPRICDVATAIVLHGYPWSDPRAVGAPRVRSVLDAADRYLNGPFLRIWNEKGPAATSPTEGLRSEADAVYFAEIWQTGTGRSVWPKLAGSVGRCLDAYFWQHTGHSQMRWGFARDDGSWAPDRPGVMPENWCVAVPWVLAKRTGSGVAAWFTQRFAEPQFKGAGTEDQNNLLAWPQILYGDAKTTPVLRGACPLGRRVPNGFVLMRTDWSPNAAVVLADVGQPYWRNRQAFDAGHFQILRGGRLTCGSGEDAFYDATPAQGGNAYVNENTAEWDVYAQSTIAHNAVTISDPAVPLSRYGRPWPARGNQRLMERDYRTNDPPVEETDRMTGRLIAYETNSFYTYAASDLSPAYPRESVRAYTRHFLFLHSGALFVCDRISTNQASAKPTWHLQLPERPRIGSEDLAEAERIHGPDNKAGIWNVPDPASWITVTSGEGRLYSRTLLPGDAKLGIVGGPKEPMKILTGPWAQTSYYGSSKTGYEYRLWPVQAGVGPQAWYRLGTPTSLGPQFGLRSNWGRLDVAPSRRSPETTFLHVLVPTSAGAAQPPEMECAADRNVCRIQITLGSARCEVTWNLAKLNGDASAGHVGIRNGPSGELIFQSDLATQVTEEKPLPGE